VPPDGRAARGLCSLLSGRGAEAASPRVHALLSLMLLQAARLPARTDAQGELVPLDVQDRSRWDRQRILDGLRLLVDSARGSEITSYHLEAGIAACHAVAPSIEETDWPHIRELYNQLMQIHPSPVVAMNRAVAVAHCDGPAAGLGALDAVRGSPAFLRFGPHSSPVRRARAVYVEGTPVGPPKWGPGFRAMSATAGFLRVASRAALVGRALVGRRTMPRARSGALQSLRRGRSLQPSHCSVPQPMWGSRRCVATQQVRVPCTKGAARRS
jgi:hypothetical protein